MNPLFIQLGVSCAFSATTNLRLQRTNTAVSTSAAWFVVHLGSPRIDWQEIIP